MELSGELAHQRVVARRLVATLDSIELHILDCLVRGMSDREIATVAGVGMESLERSRVSLMKKLDAKTIAEAVRVALCAVVDQSA